ncbi:DUF6446 family protein [Plastorhodobacter daqingensis]|uniref:DUF6446 family protein n=1 Tax=Plastorhodobacter daqingensis TaxID=1387281 RepID=A0ABW2UK08_9RHOB
MNGKILGGSIAAVALIGGAAMYYMQVYGYYQPVTQDAAAIALVPEGEDRPRPVAVTGFEGIDADSSPLRFRACFDLAAGPEQDLQGFTPYPRPEPLNAPHWFSCFDAAAIGAALEDGAAQAFLGQAEIAPGVDRVIAVFPDGRAFAWHQLNDTYRD